MTTSDSAKSVELFMQESGLDVLEAGPGEAGDARQKIAERLQAISLAAPKVEQGGLKVVVAGTAFQISQTIWPLAVCLVKLTIAAHDPTGHGLLSGKT